MNRLKSLDDAFPIDSNEICNRTITTDLIDYIAAHGLVGVEEISEVQHNFDENYTLTIFLEDKSQYILTIKKL